MHTSQSDEPAKKAGNIEWIDVAKGICIILVVMLHSTFGVVEEMGDAGLLEDFVHFAAPFRMPDFFLLSGLLLGQVINRPWFIYFDRKVVHFAYFYVLWLTIQFAFKGPALAMNEGIESALGQYAFAFVQPFGTLWFIYLLPIFFLVTRFLRAENKLLVFIAAAMLNILSIHTGSLIIDEFASRFVYFYAGYAFAPMVFRAAKLAGTRPISLLTGLGVWACLNGLAVVYNIAALPGLSLILGFAGASAIIGIAVLLIKIDQANMLRWLGANSIVVYLAFFLPMVITREILVKTGIIESSQLVALIVTITAITVPVLIHALVAKTGLGHFLFVRPEWAKMERRKSVRLETRPLTVSK